MLAFPQLQTGAMAQFPLTRSAHYRSRRNRLQDGGTLQTADPDFEYREWDLTFQDLTSSEWQALESLFVDTRGRLGVFTFLEPGANLLSWSEKLAEDPWTLAGASIPDLADPFGGSRATRLSPSGTATQAIGAPADYTYAASAWLKTSAAGATISVTDGLTMTSEQTVAATGQWSRYVVRYSGTSSAESISFSVSASSGAPLDIYGAQVEPQVAASPYKRSVSRGGVFANTRFDQDELIDALTSVGRHDVQVKLIWTPSQT